MLKIARREYKFGRITLIEKEDSNLIGCPKCYFGMGSGMRECNYELLHKFGCPDCVVNEVIYILKPKIKKK